MNVTNNLKFFGQIPPDLIADIVGLIKHELPPDWEKIPSSRNAFVVRRRREPVVYYKEFLRRSPWERLKSLVRGSRCARSLEQTRLLIEKGFQSSLPLGWGAYKNREFTISPGIDAEPIAKFLYQHWELVTSKAWFSEKRRIIHLLGKEIARLHEAGILHGDLRLNNILMKREGDGYQFYYLDNERNCLYSSLSPSQRVKNLVQLNLVSPIVISPRDRLRFFASYALALPNLSKTERKRWRAAVVRGTATRHRRKPELLHDFRNSPHVSP